MESRENESSICANIELNMAASLGLKSKFWETSLSLVSPPLEAQFDLAGLLLHRLDLVLQRDYLGFGLIEHDLELFLVLFLFFEHFLDFSVLFGYVFGFEL